MAHDAYIRFDGISSRNPDAQQPGWIRLLSFRHGLEQPMTGSAGTGGQGAPARARHGDLVIEKLLDDTSPILSLYCCSGRLIPEVTVEVWDAGAGRHKFMEYLLSDVLVRSTRVQLPTVQAPESGATLREEIGLQYARIEWNYTLNSADGPIGSVNHFWDTTQNRGG
ncbi:MAG: Hcp family type VI secretion system effector [Niveispirillum sp.]|uniref:Hcp family type VI secretion system effector n=1 Tax=Niveispirillum sp. TaxID=1917217 RepID=UPI003BA7B74E